MPKSSKSKTRLPIRTRGSHQVEVDIQFHKAIPKAGKSNQNNVSWGNPAPRRERRRGKRRQLKRDAPLTPWALPHKYTVGLKHNSRRKVL